MIIRFSENQQKGLSGPINNPKKMRPDPLVPDLIFKE